MAKAMRRRCEARVAEHNSMADEIANAITVFAQMNAGDLKAGNGRETHAMIDAKMPPNVHASQEADPKSNS